MGKGKTKGKDPGTREAPVARSQLTPIDVQQKEFRVSRFGGYKMRDVDEFLDHITDTFTALKAENDRLRTGGAAAMVGSPDLDDVGRQADEIIARARAEAARITGEAKATSSEAAVSASGPADRSAVNVFLSQEREFLQALAGLVQEHAEAVKGMAKSARSASGRTSAKPAALAAATSAAAAPPATTPTATEIATPVPAARADADDPQDAAALAGSTNVPAAAERSSGTEHEPLHEDDSGSTTDGEPTTVPEAEAAVRIEEPAPAGASRSEGSPEADRSLRELFWGED